MTIIEALIREWQSRTLPEFTHRDLDISLKGSLAAAVVGMRRSGKTWRLFQEISSLTAQGVKPGHILYFNFDDERLRSYEGSGRELLNELMETFFRLNPEARRNLSYFFFDEIQEIQDWAVFARRIIDTEKVKLFLSGSSAKLLSSEIATEFRGRSFPFELLPFSFREYLRHRGMSETPSLRERSEYEHAFSGYLSCGGFPEVLIQDDPFIRTGLLQNYLDMVVLRDVLERYGAANSRGIKELAHSLVANNGNLVSVKRLTDQLAARNIPMSRETVGRLCTRLEDACLVFFVPLFSYGLQKARVNPQKVYAVDPGLSLSLSVAPSLNLGQRFEQAVYLELRRRYPLLRTGGISYYLTEKRREVDFALGDTAQEIPQSLMQVCLSLKDRETRERETGALSAAMEELGIKEARIITLYERELIKTASGSIEVLPAWEWFLSWR
ncbi:MAG: ATP-binding protein [Treponema sp.]|nr:ATP-binding protein [Treponema sp.]